MIQIQRSSVCQGRVCQTSENFTTDARDRLGGQRRAVLAKRKARGIVPQRIQARKVLQVRPRASASLVSFRFFVPSDLQIQTAMAW